MLMRYDNSIDLRPIAIAQVMIRRQLVPGGIKPSLSRKPPIHEHLGLSRINANTRMTEKFDLHVSSPSDSTGSAYLKLDGAKGPRALRIFFLICSGRVPL